MIIQSKRLLILGLLLILFTQCKEGEELIEPTVKVSADFNTDITDIIAGQSISFIDASTGDPTGWEWEFEGGSPSFSTLQNPTITYNKSGSFSVTLTVSSASSDDVKIKTAIINVNNKVEAAFSGNITTLVEGGIVTYTDESVGEIASWNWTFENGTPSTSTEQNPIIVYTVVGQYTVTLTVADNLSESTETKTGYINVKENVIAAFSGDTTTVVEGGSVTYTDESVGEITSWNWTFENGTPSTSTEQNPTIVYNVVGQHTVTLTVADNLSESTKTGYITVIAGTSTSSTPYLDGIWESASGNVVYEIFNESGYYKEIIGGSTLQGQNDGVISVGDLKMKNISLRNGTSDTYDGDWLWLVGTTSQGYTGTEWSDPNTTTFVLISENELYVTSSHTNADGNTSTGSGTYTRRN